MFEWLKALIILPFNVIIVIPFLILYFSHFQYKTPSIAFFVIGILLLISGFILTVWTMILFNFKGKGTLAPWNPPKKLIKEGPYKYIRNPMITGVLMILTSEYFFFGEIKLLFWTIIFFIINNIYFYFFEERELEKNFKDEYLEYKKNVPLWLPKFKT